MTPDLFPLLLIAALLGAAFGICAVIFGVLVGYRVARSPRMVRGQGKAVLRDDNWHIAHDLELGEPNTSEDEERVATLRDPPHMRL